MKNKILIGFLLIFSTNSFAQQAELAEKPRPFMTGGTFWMVANTEEPNRRNTYFTLGVNHGKMINSHWLVGIGANFEYDGTSDALAVESNRLSAAIFGRYYFNPTHRFQLFTQPFVSYSYTKETVEANAVRNATINGFEVGAKLGVQYRLAPRFQLLANLGGLSYRADDASKSSFFASFNTQYFNLGFEFRY